MRRLASILASGVVVALVATAIPGRAYADDDEKKPADGESTPAALDRYPPFSTRFKVMTAGLLITGAAWGVSFGISRGWPEAPCHVTLAGSFGPDNKTPCSSGPPGYNQLGIPIVGPWIALGKSACPVDNPLCDGASIAGRGVAYVLDGIVQAAGLALIVESIVMKTEPIDGGKKNAAFGLRFRGLELQPFPVVSASMTGLGVVGTF